MYTWVIPCMTKGPMDFHKWKFLWGVVLQQTQITNGYKLKEVGKVGLHYIPLFSDTLLGSSGPLTSPWGQARLETSGGSVEYLEILDWVYNKSFF